MFSFRVVIEDSGNRYIHVEDNGAISTVPIQPEDKIPEDPQESFRWQVAKMKQAGVVAASTIFVLNEGEPPADLS